MGRWANSKREALRGLRHEGGGSLQNFNAAVQEVRSDRWAQHQRELHRQACALKACPPVEAARLHILWAPFEEEGDKWYLPFDGRWVPTLRCPMEKWVVEFSHRVGPEDVAQWRSKGYTTHILEANDFTARDVERIAERVKRTSPLT